MSLSILVESLRLGKDHTSKIPAIAGPEDMKFVLAFYISRPCFYDTAETKMEQGIITLKLLQDLEAGSVSNIRPVLRKWPDDLTKDEMPKFFDIGILKNPMLMILNLFNQGGQHFSPMQLLVLIKKGYWVFDELSFQKNLILRQDRGF